jgi:hypothetical protein
MICVHAKCNVAAQVMYSSWFCVFLLLHRVQVLRYSDGVHVRTIGSQGSGNGQFSSPCGGIAIDSDGRMVVATKTIACKFWSELPPALPPSSSPHPTLPSCCSPSLRQKLKLIFVLIWGRIERTPCFQFSINFYRLILQHLSSSPLPPAPPRQSVPPRVSDWLCSVARCTHARARGLVPPHRAPHMRRVQWPHVKTPLSA